MRARIASLLIVLFAIGAPRLLAQEPGRVLAQSGEDETWISRTEDGRRLTLRMSGEVRASEAGDRIVFVEPGGFFTMIEETPDGSRRLDARADEGGSLEVSWRIDGVERPVDAEARAWLARMLDDFDSLGEDRRRRAADVRERLEASRTRVQRALRNMERTRSAEVQRALREVERLRSEELEPAIRAAERARIEAVEGARRGAEAVRTERLRSAERAMRAAEGERTRALQRVERALRETEVLRERRLEEVMRGLQELRLRLRGEDGRRIWIL